MHHPRFLRCLCRVSRAVRLRPPPRPSRYAPRLPIAVAKRDGREGPDIAGYRLSESECAVPNGISSPTPLVYWCLRDSSVRETLVSGRAAHLSQGNKRLLCFHAESVICFHLSIYIYLYGMSHHCLAQTRRLNRSLHPASVLGIQLETREQGSRDPTNFQTPALK